MKTHFSLPSAQGFTLIELMVVLAIVAILATIAAPLYLNYMARAQVIEAVRLAEGLRPKVEVAYATKGQPIQITLAASYESRYAALEKIEANGTIVMRMKNQAAARVQGQKLYFTPRFTGIDPKKHSAAMAWDCTSPIEAYLLPEPCRSSP